MKNKIFLWFAFGLGLGLILMYFFKTYKIEKIQPTESVKNTLINNSQSQDQYLTTEDYSSDKEEAESVLASFSETENFDSGKNIDELTHYQSVIDYVKKNHRLPDFYITKSEAKKRGWNPSEGNLCEVLPGRAIGGDKFSNREGKLPKSEKYFEADVNYNCGRRNADRIVFTKSGEVYFTQDHYKTFEKQ